MACSNATTVTTTGRPVSDQTPPPITPGPYASFRLPLPGYFDVSESSIYLLFPNPNPNSNPPWIARFQSTQSGKLRILNPFSGLPPENTPSNFPKEINSLELGVIELAKAYTVTQRKDNDGTQVVDKAVALLNWVIVRYDQKMGGKRWDVSHDYRNLYIKQTCYDDLIVFRGDFCAVTRGGKTLLIDHSGLSVVAIADPICEFEGNPKNLVEMHGDLYMVDRDLGAYTTTNTMTVKLRVYKLDREKKLWTEINDLGDSALFGFSTRFLPGCKGNCVYFVDQFSTYNPCFNEGDDGLREFGCPEAGVFDLKHGTVMPLWFSPDLLGLFWPPPLWWLHPS